MDIFELNDYREIVRARIKLLAKKGYGQLTQLAKHIGVNATLVSQILSGAKNFTEEQGCKAAEFFQLNEKETIYLLLLIQRERAGTHPLKVIFDKQISAAQKDARRMRGRITVDRELTFEQQAVFYSDWLYTAVHTLSSIEQMQSTDAIVAHLKLPRPRVMEAVTWLLQHGVCKQEKGRLVIGPAVTYVDRDSSLALRHHSNWRQKSVEVMGQKKENDFFFTAPFSISKRDFELLKKELVQWIDCFVKRVEKTNPELMATVNIDLFQT